MPAEILDKIVQMDAILWNSGEQPGIDIKDFTNVFIKQINVRLQGDIVKVGATAGTVIADGTIQIPKFFFVVEGLDHQSIPGRLLHYYNTVEQCLNNGMEPLVTNIPDGAADTDAIVGEFTLPLAPMSFNKVPLYFPTMRFESVRLEVLWTSNLDTTLLSGHTGNDTTSTNLRVVLEAIVSDYPVQRNIKTIPYFKQTSKVVTFTAADTDLKIKLDRGDQVAHTNVILVITDDDVRSATMMNNISVRYGEDRYRIKPRATTLFDREWREKLGIAPISGVYHIDLTPDQVVGRASRADEDLFVVCDVDAPGGTTGRVELLQSRLVTPRA